MVQGFIQLFGLLFLVTMARLTAQTPDPCLCEDWRTKHPEWIWCDDFESTIPMLDKYFEYGDDQGDFIPMDGVGINDSRGMRVRFQSGEVSAGGFKKSFGRTPSSYIGRHAERPKEDFDEIYWQMSIRRQAGWQGGGGAKLSRATSFATDGWAQGMIAHVWSSGPGDNYLLIDPASGISTDGTLTSTRYNDFDNLRWLGNKRGQTPLFNQANADKWFCVEAHAKLNTPGKSDGIFEFWIDGKLEARHTQLNWHSDWNNDPSHYKINAVFFENYWNAGSPKTQDRYFDNIVISTQRIDCHCIGGDIDEDGIPDAEESTSEAYEVGKDDRKVDSDLDGMFNAAEYLAGTDPLDPSSNFKIATIQKTDNQIEICFSSVMDRSYLLEFSNSLTHPEWKSLPETSTAGNNQERCILLDDQSLSSGYFRLLMQ
jgi:hypothetical protein